MSTIVDVLGEFLSNELDIKPIQGKGIVRLGIKDVIPEKAIEKMTLEELKNAINKGIKGRLDKINITNSDTVVGNLIQYIVKNQSLITMLGM